MRIVWDITAKKELKKIYDHIKLDSLQNAEMVREGIVKATASLDKNFVYRPDKYKRNNDGSYRAFEIYSYRISYRITLDEIKILRLRHVRMRPKRF
jgi:plasmid stabilization system protein ParE